MQGTLPAGGMKPICYGRGFGIPPNRIGEPMTADSPLSYTVSGMTCGHCEQAVTEEITQLSGVQEVNVDLATGRVDVEGRDLDDAAIRAAIDEAGYEVAA